MRRWIGISALVALLAGCGTATASPPNWVPQTTFAGDGGQNNNDNNAQDDPNTTAPASPSGSGSNGTPSAGAQSSQADDPDVLARHLSSPTGLVILPDGSALVGERSTGRIVSVQPQPNQPVVEVKTLTGLDTSGDGGLLDLALSPTYSEDGLIYAYITTPTDNRVVDFTKTGTPTPVLTGIPKGSTGNTGRIVFSTDGNLYIGTGDTGNPALAANGSSLAGKVLRVSPIGQTVGASLIFASGLHESDGLCVNSAGVLFQTESDGSSDELNQVASGQNYGWPTPATGSVAPVATAPKGDSGFGGCAVIGPVIYLTSRDGTDLLGAPLTNSTNSAAAPKVGDLVSEGITKYGRLKTVVAAPDGALWLTTTNLDGKGKPSADDERVIRIIPQSGGADSPV